jgi:hypothetical protein
MDMTTMPSEPLTAIQEGAAAMHELFTAYIGAGFSRPEALQLCIGHVTSAARSPREED